ncbi:MAG: HAD-IB family hydrolase [Anaerolineae bacterium]|nr:HAD-IB family hydrolase [Anaerolineae bacterium]
MSTIPETTVGAFFDMDRTLLRDSSGRLYLKYLRATNRLSLRQWLVITYNVARYLLGLVEFPQLMGWLTARVGGADESEAWRLSRAWFDAMLRHYIADEARRRVRWHQEQGHHVAIVSAATPFAVAPVAHSLGLGDSYLATRLEIVAGRFTGRLVEPVCFGEGKLLLARAYAAEHGLDLRHSYFYSDSHDDLPLLEAVGHPVAVNPSRKLARIAKDRGWPGMFFY